MRGENRSTRRKTSQNRVGNQQTQSTYDGGSRDRTRATLVEGECSHQVLRQPCRPKSAKSGKRLFVTLFMTKVVPCPLTCSFFSGTRRALVHNPNEKVWIFEWCCAGGTANGCQSKSAKCLAGSTISWFGMVYHPHHILAKKKKKSRILLKSALSHPSRIELPMVF